MKGVGGPGEVRTPDPMVAKHIPDNLPTFAAVCESPRTVAMLLMVSTFQRPRKVRTLAALCCSLPLFAHCRCRLRAKIGQLEVATDQRIFFVHTNPVCLNFYKGDAIAIECNH